MSDETVTVRIPAADARDAEGALREMMAPYAEETTDPRFLEFEESEDGDVDPETGRRGYWYNPRATWNQYVIGGRRSGHFPCPGAFPTRGVADACRTRDIDWARVRRETAARARRFWSEWLEFLGGRRFEPFKGPRTMAFDLALLEVVEEPVNSTPTSIAIPWARVFPQDHLRWHWTDVARLISEEDFLRQYEECFNPLATYAALDSCGWHSHGRLGWFGATVERLEPYAEFKRSFVSRYVACAGDDLLVLVDYHI